ncbi:hypothetical protein SAMN05216274_10586 [Cryobacterium levicorallinum]|nr:hypothetical protein SAMN05216274_10586 [Cryobacterium levicorallinum]
MTTLITRKDVTRSGAESLPSTHRKFAAIVDLENVAIFSGEHVSPAHMHVLLNAIGTQVSGMPVRLATGINVLRPYMDLVGLQHWGLTLVETKPDAADDALFEAARDFIICGATDIVVASGDHSFIPLAAHVNLHVISHATHLSKSLRLAATTVTHLPNVRTEFRAAG